MTENHPWDDGEMQAVDIAGCEKETITRPAKLYYGSEEVELKTPNAPNGWIKTEDNNVDLAQWR